MHPKFRPKKRSADIPIDYTQKDVQNFPEDYFEYLVLGRERFIKIPRTHDNNAGDASLCAGVDE